LPPPQARSPDAEHHAAQRPHQSSGRFCGVAGYRLRFSRVSAAVEFERATQPLVRRPTTPRAARRPRRRRATPHPPGGINSHAPSRVLEMI
jgi:hypothetical protein